jgi:hypothetical protein
MARVSYAHWPEKGAAGRHTFIAHRGVNEDFIDGKLFGKQAIEPHIGERTAGQTKVASFGQF